MIIQRSGLNLKYKKTAAFQAAEVYSIKKQGFTIIELLIVISIIAILSSIGVVIFSGTKSNARNSVRKSDVLEITRAFETQFNPVTGVYPALQDSWFASAVKPTPPEGGQYNVIYSANNTGFRVCAVLEGTSGSCTEASATCFCKESTQGIYMVPFQTPSLTPTPSVAPSVLADPSGFRNYMAGVESTLDNLANTLENYTPPGAQPNTVVTYPGPPGITASNQYSVRVLQDQGAGYIPFNSFVYKVLAQKLDTNIEADTSWTTFSFSGPIILEVTKIGVTATTCSVRPNNYLIAGNISAGKCYVSLSSPKNISVEINGDVIRPMLVFANPLEVNPPTGPSANVVYFGPGVYDIGQNYQLQSNKTYYLAGGAYLKGTFQGLSIQNVVIRGRGIISGEQYAHQANGGLISMPPGYSGRSNIVVDGITLIQSPYYNIDLRGFQNIIRNNKLIGWYFNTDGIGCGIYCLVKNNFVKVNDDSTKISVSTTIASNNVFWQLENGSPFQISWNMTSSQSNFYVHDNIVMRTEQIWDNPNEAIVDAVHGGSATMSNYLFENLTVEDANWRLFYLSIQPNEFATGPLGRITQILFNNVVANNNMTLPSRVFGADSTHTVDNIQFNKVTVAGQLITPANKNSYFVIDPLTTSNITFTNIPL